jgi:endonuclease/exonuclease/phosphatase family metal-dependent hydrolase
MKNFLLTCCLVINSLLAWPQAENIPAFGAGHTLEIATWNIENFPKNGQSTIDYVTQIIQALDIDIIALQEISDTVALRQVVNNLPGYAYYCITLWYGGLAYIYKTDLIQVNDCYEIHTTPPYWSPFPRSPLVLDLNYLGNQIFIINNHFKCCGDGILDLNDSGDEETRRFIAAMLLKDYIDDYLPDNMVLVVGDLNDDIAEAAPNNVFVNLLNDSQNFLFADMDIAQGSSSGWSYPTWPSHLDHILITNELFPAFQHQDADIQTLKIDQYFTNGWYEYETHVSDHRPVAIKLKISDNTNVEPLTVSYKFEVYPNPASGIVNFRFSEIPKDARIEIYNLMGQLVASKDLTENQQSIALPVDDLTKGIYSVKLQAAHNTALTQKITIY